MTKQHKLQLTISLIPVITHCGASVLTKKIRGNMIQKYESVRFNEIKLKILCILIQKTLKRVISVRK